MMKEVKIRLNLYAYKKYVRKIGKRDKRVIEQKEPNDIRKKK